MGEPEIIAIGEHGGTRYEYALVPKTLENPERHGWQVMMRMEGNPRSVYEPFGAPWNLDPTAALAYFGGEQGFRDDVELLHPDAIGGAADRRTRDAERERAEAERRAVEEATKLTVRERHEQISRAFKAAKPKFTRLRSLEFVDPRNGVCGTLSAGYVHTSGLAVTAPGGDLVSRAKLRPTYHITHLESMQIMAGPFTSLPTAKLVLWRLAEWGATRGVNYRLSPGKLKQTVGLQATVQALSTDPWADLNAELPVKDRRK
jgi:hypothetical protein